MAQLAVFAGGMWAFIGLLAGILGVGVSFAGAFDETERSRSSTRG